MKVDDYKGTNFKATLISEFFMFGHRFRQLDFFWWEGGGERGGEGGGVSPHIT